ncbi:MAG: prepilin peptidase [Paraburkholderia sp.]|uniref:A24 family peptidase n=1 Tax=Paraburkholderia sp. TaxID=1926495 RepID=UPI003C5B6D17
MSGVPFPAGHCVVALVIVAAVWDWRTRRIPNWLVATALIVALPLQITLHGAHDGIQIWFGGCLAGGLILLPGYLMRALGAGDVKLMAAVGALCGAALALEIAVIASAIGGIWALVWLLRRKRVRAGLSNTMSMLITMSSGTNEAGTANGTMSVRSVGRLPFGVAIALGAVGTLMAGV